MRALRPGLWYWQAPHPGWRPGEPWDQDVSSYAIEDGSGLAINERWLGPSVTREQVVEGLRPLLELPVEQVLATHGGPFDRAALERALS